MILRQRDTYVNNLAKCLIDGQTLRTVPELIKRIIEEDAWRERVVSQTGEVAKFKRFKDFVEAYPPEGLRTTINLLIDICKSYDDMQAVAMIAQTEAGDRGGNNNPYGAKGKPGINDNNVNIDYDRESGTGNATTYTMRRLAKDAPEFHAKVIAGELTPNKAMVSAGLRVPPMQMPQDPTKAGRYLACRVDRAWMEEMLDVFYSKIDG